IVTGCADLRTGLPPTVLTADDAWVQAVVQARTRADASVRSLDADPISGTNASLRGGRGMQLDLGLERAASQARQPAMLALAELGVLGAREDQRVSLDVLRSRPRTHLRLLVLRDRRVPVLREQLRVDLDLARRRREPLGNTIHYFGVLAIARLQR